MYRRDLGHNLASVENLRKQAFKMLDDCFRLTHAIPRIKDSQRYKTKLFTVHKYYLKQGSKDDLLNVINRTNVSIYRMLKI